MVTGPHIVTLYFNARASGRARHQVDVPKVDLGKKGHADARMRIKNDTDCKVRVCFATELFDGLTREPDPGTPGTYWFADIESHRHLDLRTTDRTKATTPGASDGDGYQFRFMGAGCEFPHVGDIHRTVSGRPRVDPGDDPRVVIGD